MEWLKQFARLFGWRNKQFESLHEWNQDGWKIRVWRTNASLTEAYGESCRDIEMELSWCPDVGRNVRDLHAKLMAMPRVACVAIVDANGNGVSAYPDWH